MKIIKLFRVIIVNIGLTLNAITSIMLIVNLFKALVILGTVFGVTAKFSHLIL